MTINSLMPGDIKVTSTLLYNLTKSYSQDISNQINSIDIYESIFSPIIFAEISITDGINLQEKFPIKGEEWFTLVCQTPGLPKNHSINLNLRVIRKSDVTTDPQGKTSFYKLTACSEEFQHNARTVISKTYTERTISEMIKDLVTNSDFLNTTKKLSLEGGSTKGAQTVTIPSFNPLQAIDFLRQRAVSDVYPSSAFVFYETRKGFYFTNIEHLFEQGNKTKDTNPIFYYHTTKNNDFKKTDVEQARNIISYRHLVYGDPILSANRGGFKNKVVSHDLRTAVTTTIVTNKSDISKKAQYGGKKTVHTSPALNDDLETDHPSTAAFILVNSRKPPTFREISIGANRIYAEQLIQNLVRFFVSGDASIAAGQMITLNLPQFRSTTEDGNQSRKSKYASGSYLVTKVRHTLVHKGRWQHATTIECTKGAFGSV